MNESRGDFKTDATWQDSFAKSENPLPGIPSQRIGDMIRHAERLGATEKQVDDALDQPEMRPALITLINSLQDLPHTCARELGTAASNALEEVGQTKILVIGATGDGKSTLVNNLKLDAEREAVVSLEVKGTTKTINAFRGKHNTIIVDTPGVGDYDVSVTKLYMLLEEALSQKDCRIDYVIVTVALTNVQFNLALQIVHLLVKKGFDKNEGHEWTHIIVCGTKRDRAEPQEMESFQTLADLFFEAAPNKTGARVMVDQSDVNELEKAISTKPAKGISFQAIREEELACELSARLGFRDNDEFLEVLEKDREAMATECHEVQAKLKLMVEKQ